MILRKPLYNDGVYDIVRYAARDGEVFSVALQGISSNAEINKYLVYVKGSIIVRDKDGNIVLVRNEGDTTDSSRVEIPEGIYLFEADGELSEFYSVSKMDGTAVIRKENRMQENEELQITEDSIVFLAIGTIINGNGDDVVAPTCFSAKAGDTVMTMSQTLLIELR